MDATEIARCFSISQPAVSKHLKRLLQGALVTRRVEAQRRVYALNPDGLADVEAWVSARRTAWEQRLSKLEQFVVERRSREPGGSTR